MKKILLMLLITLPMLAACPLDGPTGRAGANGPQGIQGAPGVQGEQGIPGAAGGIQGPNGMACWDLNEDGLQTLADPDDDTVISEDINGDGEINVVDCTGLKGDVGNAGADGAAGLQGETGDTGETGEIGADGVRGFTGAPGPTGADGKIGTQGAIGPAGTDGKDGKDGQDGDGAVCRMGVYITGAYLLEALDDGTGTLVHTSQLIVSAWSDPRATDPNTILHGIFVLDTTSGASYSLMRNTVDGTLEYPLVGSCLAPPPA